MRRKKRARNKGKFYLLTVVLMIAIAVVVFKYGVFDSSSNAGKVIDEQGVNSGEDVSTNNENEEDNSQEPIQIVEEEFKTATILAAGDIMFHTTQLKAGYNKEDKTYNFDDFFKSISPYVKAADIAICNLETVTAGSKYRYIGYPTFNTPDEAIGSIKNAGFDILTTANNHCLDKKKQGLIRTLDVIDQYGLKSTGTYRDENHPLLIEEVNGIKMAFLSYTYGCNGMGKVISKEDLNKMVNLIDEEKIKNDIKLAKNENVDLIIASMHWGYEYNRKPNDMQKNLANVLVEQGVDIILGSHPHVVQKSDILKHEGEDKFVIYSMGNLISNQRRETMGGIMNKEYTEDGLMVQLEVQKDLKTNKTIIKGIKYIPTWVNRYQENGKFNYDIVPTIEFVENDATQSDLPKDTQKRITESYKHTMELMDEEKLGYVEANSN